MKPFWLVLAGLLLAGLLNGCLSPVRYDYEGERESLLMAESLGEIDLEPGFLPLELNDEIRLALDERIVRSWSQSRKLRELRSFLFSERERHIVYNSGETGTAIQTYNERTGNCLAMTTVFIASARYVGLDAHYQLVEVEPSWDHQRGTMIRYEHIVATGRLPREKYLLDFLPEFGISDDVGKRIDDSKALALYYNNQGAEYIVSGDLENAIDRFRMSLKLNPDHSDTWNNLGAAMFRSGKVELAEFSYHRSLYEDPSNSSAIAHLVRLYKSEGRDADAAEMKERVQRYRKRNPYYYYFLANVSLSGEDYEAAIPLLKRAIRLKRDESDFHAALALSFANIGDEQESREHMILAEKYKHDLPVSGEQRVVQQRLVLVRKASHLKN